ncbi:MAG: hypothetical protein RLZZ584_3688 [Pseudomonadota bacterium]
MVNTASASTSAPPTVPAPARRSRAPATARHVPLMRPPWFAGKDETVCLHRYLDEQFVPRFIQDAQAGRLQGTLAQGWYDADKVGRHKDAPLLRLPMHRAFYVASVEVACNTFGQPAFDPARVTSAGLVVRRVPPPDPAKGAQTQRWLLREGEALGWQPLPADAGRIEPDDYRRYLARGLIQPRQPEPPYSGEETHPMHPLLVRVRDGAGQLRNHTLLWGYLPLGGSYRVAEPAPLSPSEAAALGSALQAELSWPYGSRGARPWQASDSRPVLQGQANLAFQELLEQLLRSRVADEHDSDNTPLRVLLQQIRFYPPPVPHPPQPYDRYAAPVAGTGNLDLLQWLIGTGDAADAWLSGITNHRTSLSTSRLPWPGGGTAPFDLVITAEQAASLRELLASRAQAAMARNDLGLAMPRYPQGDDDLFELHAFVRWTDDCGCERITWAPQGSLKFRVASPLDPDFQRPQAIILPRLDDLKRGAARGVALLAPKSLADQLRKISPAMPPGSDGPGNRCQLCWMVSLSIPVVTLCAMIILMILINLLNLIFGWLPWALLALPRWCGKLLKED